MDGAHDPLGILKKSSAPAIDPLGILGEKKNPGGSDGTPSSSSSDSGLAPFQSSLVNGIPVLPFSKKASPIPFVKQGDKDAAVTQANAIADKEQSDFNNDTVKQFAIQDQLRLVAENKKTDDLIGHLTTQDTPESRAALQQVLNANASYNKLTPVGREQRRVAQYGSDIAYQDAAEEDLKISEDIKKRIHENTKEESWLNVPAQLAGATSSTVTKTLSGLVNLTRNYNINGIPAIKLYNEDGSLSPYGKIVEEDGATDPLGKMILGLDGQTKKADYVMNALPLPNTIAGRVTKDMTDFLPDVAATALLPESKAAEIPTALNTLGRYVWNPFTKWMVAKGALQSYGEAEQHGEDEPDAAIAAAKGAGQGAVSGVSAGVLGGIAGKMSDAWFSQLVKRGLVTANGAITKGGVDILSDATIFGAAPIVQVGGAALIDGQPIDKEDLKRQIESGIGTGLVFGGLKAYAGVKANNFANDEIKTYMNARQTDALENFNRATPEAIIEAYNSPVSSGDLNAKALDVAAQARLETDPDKKAQLILLAKTYARASDAKGVANAIINDKDGFVHSIAQSDIKPDDKAILISKFDQIDNLLNPKKLEQNINKDNVENLTSEIDNIQASPTGSDPVANPEAVDNLIDLVEKRTDIQVDLLNKADEIHGEQHIEEPGERPTPIERAQAVSPNTGNAEGALPVDSERNGVNAVAGESLPGNGGEQGTGQVDNNNVNEGEFQYRSKEFNPVNITPGKAGEFNVKFDDGTEMSLPKEDIKSLFGFDTDKLDAPEQEARLHGTDNPEEVARMYDDKVKELQDTGSIEAAIAAYGPRTNSEEFGRVNDPNNETGGIRLNYFRKDGGDADLNNQADEINRQSFNGEDKVTANDLAEFMINYPGGAATYTTAAGNAELKAISDRYAELTGKEISNRFAKNLARQYGNVTMGEIRAIQNEYDGLANEDKVSKFIEDKLSDPSLNDPEHVLENVRDQFNDYADDPSNMFNIWHDVFNGEEVPADLKTIVNDILDEKNNDKAGDNANGEEFASPGEGSSVISQEATGGSEKITDELSSPYQDDSGEDADYGLDKSREEANSKLRRAKYELGNVHRNKAYLEKLLATGKPKWDYKYLMKQGKSIEDMLSKFPQHIINAEKALKIAEKAVRDLEPSRRGVEFVSKRISQGVKAGKISQESADLANALLNKNPELFKDLAINITLKKDKFAAGQYSSKDALITLFKDNSKTTAIHEIFHHTERFLPTEIRDGILKEWGDSLHKEKSLLEEKIDASKDEKQKEKLSKAIRYLTLADQMQTESDYTKRQEIRKELKDIFRSRVVPHSYYEFFSPSEWWAVNAADSFIKSSNVGDTWIGKAKVWYNELLSAVKNVLGINKIQKVESGIKEILSGKELPEQKEKFLQSLGTTLGSYLEEKEGGIDENSKAKEDEFSLQKGEGDKLPPERAKVIQNLLEQVFPSVETKFHTDVDSFERAAKKAGIEATGDALPNAFVDTNNIIHFNPERVNADTQIHEFGHILTRWARENSPGLWDRMIRIGNDAAGVHAELRQKGYELSGNRMGEEAFVTMLGRDGEGKLNEVIKNSGSRGTVAKFINDSWIKFQRYVLEKTGYDISKFKNIKNMSMHEFLDTINSKYLLSEVKIGDIGNKEFSETVSEQKQRPLRQAGETSAEYAGRVLDWIKEKQAAGDDISFANLKKNLAPARETIAKANRDFNAGFKAAQLEQKAAFLEYDRYQKEVAAERLQKERDLTKEKFGEYVRDQGEKQKAKLKELKGKYDEKLAKEKQLRQDQTKALKDNFNNIRKEIKNIIVDLNKSGAFGKIKFSDKQLLGFANQLNSVKTERGLDRFRDFVARAAKDAEVIRDVQDARSGIKDARQLLKANFVPQNIKDAIKDLVTINSYDAKDVKRFNRILDDINNGQRMKEFSSVPMQEVHDFINEEKEHNLTTRADDIIQNHQEFYYGDDLFNYKQTQFSTLPDRSEIASTVSRVLRDPDTTYNEKVKKLNNINDALDIYKQSVKDSIRIDPEGNSVADTPAEDFHKILDTINDKPNELSETLRDSLENIASAKQDLIEIDPSMSPEQKESLKILKEVPLAGQDADTLRLFNNVLENVINNDDHSGIGIFEAKAIGNGDEGALKLPNYLEETGRKSKSARFKTKLGELRAIGANLSVIMSRIANNDFDFLSKLNTGSHFDEIRNGFAQAKHRYDELIGKKLEVVFKENPTIAKSPESIQRLSLFSYINQNREFSSPEQQNAELIRRVDIIKRDIELKAAEGLKNDNSEAAIERDIWQGFSDKIKDATGIDVADGDQLKNLSYDQIRQIEFLESGERKVYDVYRAADDELRPAHQDVVKRQLNMPYEAWDNHMRDGYRFLGTGLVDVVSGEGLGFTAMEQNTTNGSVATLQRVKGDPLASKSGEKQKVLNLNFFDVQNQNIKDQLSDIHTLKSRQIFDEALKNRTLRDALGNENHQMYKETVRNNVLNEMGLNNSVGEKELRLMKQGLNIITKLGTFKQLLSYSALVKQASATIFNTLVNIGGDAKLMHDAASVLNSDEVKALIKKHPISERGDNMASLNTLRDEALADKDNTIKGNEEKGVIKKMFDHTEKIIDKYLLQLNPDGTTVDRNIAKPIKYGDVKTGEWAWVTYYADHLMKNGGAVDFKAINWAKEAESPNREAADYAENITAKQLNENSKSARSKLINSNNAFYMAAKTLLFPFGSFNMHKFQTLAENFRTIASKDTFVDADYRKNQAGVAAKSLMSALVEETFFQGIKLSIGYGLTAFVTKGLAYGLTSIFGDDKEKKDVLDKIDIKLQQKRDNFIQQWYTNTLGNYFFGGIGNGPQDAAQRGINNLTNSNFFYEPNISVGQQISEANNYGMYGAAFNGMGDIAKDAYRVFDNTDKYGVPVNITPYQKAVIASSMLSNMLAFAGLNDADFNRSVDALRKQVEYGLASKFHEPNYRDLSQPTPLKINDKVIELSQEHQYFYEQIKEPHQQELERKGMAPKKAASVAAQYAKQKLIEKFSYQKIVAEGEEIKKKK
jgi:hypothetical protein